MPQTGDSLVGAADYATGWWHRTEGRSLHRVLVVDDELPVARAIERWLVRGHLEVVVLCDPTQFEQELARVHPTAVMSDLVMPGIDGISLLQQARALAPEVKRCLISGSVELVTAEQRASVEPCLFLSKPWDDTSLARVLALLEGRE